MKSATNCLAVTSQLDNLCTTTARFPQRPCPHPYTVEAVLQIYLDTAETNPLEHQPATMQIPLFEPKSPWRPPVTLPQMGPVVAIDLETRDPNIKTKGPGWKHHDGEVIGIAIADHEKEIYLPFGHQGGGNLARNVCADYTRLCVQRATEVIMANAQYDLGWLKTLGIEVSCPVRDIQVAEALLDEERNSYSLDAIAYTHLKKRKDEKALRKASKAYETANPKGFNPKADMWQLHSSHVGHYAEQDARLTFDIYPLQMPLLHKDGLWKVWELECEVTKALLYMTEKGCPVDLVAAEKLRDRMIKRERELSVKFKDLDIWSPPKLAAHCLKLGIQPPKTTKGNYSVNKEFLQQSDHAELKQIHEARGLNRLRKVFIEDIVLNGSYKGRIHADFKQTTSDDGGTRSGRLSSSNPNMQQVPKRSVWGKEIRKLYVAEPDTRWCKADYSSQEPRLQVHYALILNNGLGLNGAKQAAQSFRDGIKLYTYFEETTGLPYDTCKMLCLGISYGMGAKKMAEQLGVSEEECREILRKFNTKAPFLRNLFDDCMAAANQRGYIKTILGRRSRFDKWQAGFGGSVLTSRQAASDICPRGDRVTRAFTSKALNRLIQGSAADQSKLALVECFKAGLDIRLPVHDEINAMVTSDQEITQLTEIMENVIQLKVPTIADIDVGSTWC